MSTYQVVIKGRYDTGNQLRTVLHYNFPDYTPDATEKQAFIDELDGDLFTHLQAHMHTTVHIDTYGMRKVDVASQPEAEIIPTAGAWSGSIGGDRLPMQASALVTWKAFSTFPRTTRTYFWPSGEADNHSTGQPLAGYVTDLLTLAADWLEIVVPGQVNAMKVAVKYTGSPPAVTSENVVTTASVSANWATQRRRRPGVGI